VLGCDYSWTSYNDSNVYGGTRYESSNSVTDCQESCTRDANCTGVDYNPLNADGWRCFLILTAAGSTVNVGLTPGVTHYSLTRNCSEFYTIQLNSTQLLITLLQPRQLNCF